MKIAVTIIDSIQLPGGFSTIAIDVPERGAHEVVDIGFGTLFEAFGVPDAISLDLVLVAAIAYVIDKGVARRYADDAWTRDFQVELPVSDPKRWEGARAPLERALRFLTGDAWTITYRRRTERLYTPPRARCGTRRASPATAVSLFSGGLDSLIGTLDRLARPGERVLLVGHHDAAGPSGDQERVHRVIAGVPSYQGRTQLGRVRVRPLPPRSARAGQTVAPALREHTLRSRSFVFLALGLYAARAIGPDVPLLVPENGFIAINIPLTPSRIGTCSTRTTHPLFLDRVRAVVEAIGVTNPIDNPLSLKTKGETVIDCADQATLQRLAPETVSCAHASRRGTWLRREARNCGYCVPCLIRRASLHRAGWDDGHQYGRDICQGELDLDVTVASDVRAVLDCLSSVDASVEIEDRVLDAGALPPPHDVGVYTAMVGRGLDELRALVRDKGDLNLRRRAGLP